MRRRDTSRLRQRLLRRSLPPPGLSSRLRSYVNYTLTSQVILAVIVVIVMVVGVSSGVTVLSGRSSQGVNTGKQIVNSPSPDIPSITVEPPAPSSSPSHQIPLEQYVTSEGETIADVTSATGRSTETLLWANTISDPDKPLPTGSRLNIPQIDGVLHLVQAGDTIESIAEVFEVEPDSVTGYAPNHVAGDGDLVPGQMILVPGASFQGRERIVTYDVRPGDTVESIAGRFGLEPNAILSANEMDEPRLIYAGQELIIPPPNGVVAKVQPGDSLTTLAEKWGVDPETIAEYPGNGITDPNALVAGQSLVIPIEQASTALEGDNPGTTGTAMTGNSPQPDSSDPDSTSNDPTNGARKPAKPADSATPSAKPKPTSPDASPQPATPEPTQAPAVTPSPEADVTTSPQPSPANTENSPDTEPSSAAHPRGNFIWPAKGSITQHFGPTNVATDPPYDDYKHFHTGLDIANERGTPVVAADDGIIAFAGWATDGLGYTVKIDHADGFVTWYGHLAESPSVRPGEQIGKGEYLGPMGNTGNSAGPHVHFKVVHHDTYLNPVDHLP